MSKTKISISLCPNELEFPNRDRYDHAALLEAIKVYALKQYPDAKFTCLQVGGPGAMWMTVDEGGAEDDLDRVYAGDELMAAFFEDHGSDENLFCARRTA